MQSMSQTHCTCSDVLVGSRRPFTDCLTRQHRRAGLRAHRRSSCHAAWHSDIHRHDAAAEDVLSGKGAHAPSYQRPQQLVEVSAAPSPAQQQVPAFLGTPKGAAAALALAGVTGLGLRALFSKGSRWERQIAFAGHIHEVGMSKHLVQFSSVCGLCMKGVCRREQRRQ